MMNEPISTLFNRKSAINQVKRLTISYDCKFMMMDKNHITVNLNPTRIKNIKLD